MESSERTNFQMLIQINSCQKTQSSLLEEVAEPQDTLVAMAVEEITIPTTGKPVLLVRRKQLICAVDQLWPVKGKCYWYMHKAAEDAMTWYQAVLKQIQKDVLFAKNGT